MSPELSAIERRLDELNERLQRLEPMRTKSLVANLVIFKRGYASNPMSELWSDIKHL